MIPKEGKNMLTIDAIPVIKCRYCSYWNEYPASRGKSDSPKGKCTRLQKETAFYNFCSKGKDKYDNQ